LRALSLVVLLAGSLLAAGCTSVGYYYQAMSGQMQIWHRSRPISQMIDESGTDAALRERLQAVQRIRDFASRELALPDNSSYRKYADLERQFVVWNVFATEEFSIDPVTWCFPIAGCVAYRGYFKEAAANKFADGLRTKNLDVLVAGVAAYSTLGWFDDPVLNTFIHDQDVDIARLLFHELAHQIVYVQDDSSFNESFATAVELEGTGRWLDKNGTPEQRAKFEARQVRRREFVELIGRYRERLRALYKVEASAVQKRLGKSQTFAELKNEYEKLKTLWGGYTGYDGFFREPLTNARLVPVATYSEWVPAFRKLLAEQGGDLKRFYDAVREIAKLPTKEREQRLGGKVNRSAMLHLHAKFQHRSRL
jgi:predicted aminopeptidase